MNFLRLRPFRLPNPFMMRSSRAPPDGDSGDIGRADPHQGPCTIANRIRIGLHKGDPILSTTWSPNVSALYHVRTRLPVHRSYYGENLRTTNQAISAASAISICVLIAVQMIVRLDKVLIGP